MIESSGQVIQQAVDLLSELSDDDYTRVMQPSFSASIGQHVRHIVDHFNALHSGLVTGRVNYNVRQRGAELEVCSRTAIHQLVTLQTWLSTLEQTVLSTPLQVISEVSLCELVNAEVRSSFGRELVFVTSHAVHHYSLLAVMRKLQGANCANDFGVAPATLSHKRG